MFGKLNNLEHKSKSIPIIKMDGFTVFATSGINKICGSKYLHIKSAPNRDLNDTIQFFTVYDNEDYQAAIKECLEMWENLHPNQIDFQSFDEVVFESLSLKTFHNHKAIFIHICIMNRKTIIVGFDGKEKFIITASVGFDKAKSLPYIWLDYFPKINPNFENLVILCYNNDEFEAELKNEMFYFRNFDLKRINFESFNEIIYNYGRT